MNISPGFARTAHLGWVDITDLANVGVRVTAEIDAVNVVGGVDVIATMLRDRLRQKAPGEGQTFQIDNGLQATNFVLANGRIRFIDIELAKGV